MTRAPFTALASGLLTLALACGGGGGGTSPVQQALNYDSDPTASPAPDAAYYQVPSTPLGALISGGTVTFAHWNPRAASVSVRLYNAWDTSLGSPAASVPMMRGTGGVWQSAAMPLPSQPYYDFLVDGMVVLDPYARAMAQWTHNGFGEIAGDPRGKGALVDPAAALPDGGWIGGAAYFDGSRMKAPDGVTPAPYAYASNRDAIIYEAGIRDLTVDPFLAGFAPGHPWGTYKGLVDLLPHIQRLGVTHVQLLCPLQNYTYDQRRVGIRELDAAQTTGANYNWGYDPQNYFTPTGMYSAAPGDPAARLNELKTLVNEIHRQGMGVILDVVYNHTANNEVLGDSALPGYWYRSSSANGAGSRDVRTEAKMVRKLVVDSVVQWVRDYRVDGFRFDLMGVLDAGTVQTAYRAARDLNPKVLFLGEGWNGFYRGGGSDYLGQAAVGADQNHVAAFQGLNVAMFSDSYRQLLKNGYPTDGSPAFLSGAAQPVADLWSNVKGVPTNGGGGFAAPTPDQVVNYLTCHDNLCLYDALSLATNSTHAQDDTILARARVGYAVLMTSQGAAFLQAGDEMFRTRETTARSGAANTRSNGSRTFVDNAYNASDALNMVRWDQVYSSDPLTAGFSAYATAQPGYRLYSYLQGLIALRKATQAFRLPDAARASAFTLIPAQGAGASALAFGYQIAAPDGTGTFVVLHNAEAAPRAFTVPADLRSAQLLVDGTRAGTTPLAASATATLSPDGLTVTLAPLSSAIYRR